MAPAGATWATRVRARAGRLPTFVVIGAAKAGTTALHGYLEQHPAVAMSRRKETNHFALVGQLPDFRGPGDADAVNAHAVTDPEAYAAQFAHAGAATAVGESSPLYLYDPAVAARLRAAVSDVRVVAVLRHPAERAYSAFLHTRRDGREPLADFAAALAAEEERIAQRWEHLWHYRAMGRYATQLQRWLDAFPREQVAVHLYEELAHDPVGLVQAVFRFLEVDDAFVPDVRERPNRSCYDDTPALDAGVRTELCAYYAEEVGRLEELLGRDLAAWSR